MDPDVRRRDGSQEERDAVLCLRLFGRPEALIRGTPMPAPRTRKGLWILALLALREGFGVERRWLATLLWPDTAEELALYNLRRSLSDLRDCLGQEAGRIVSPTPRSLAMEPIGAYVDVLAFDRALKRGDSPSVETAVSLYSGPLLEGCLEEWVLPERDAREQALLKALDGLAAESLQRGDSVAAARYCRRALQVDPVRETAVRGLMRALRASGDHAAAIQSYREFRSLLRREMNVEPGPETIRLSESIRGEARQRFEAARPHPGRGAEAPAADSERRHIPTPGSPIIGRSEEVRRVLAALRTHRAVVLTGPGGVGKTRLAVAVATEWADETADGVCFADLSALTDGSNVATTVLRAMEARPERYQSPREALAETIGSRHVLLVLDNCEHLTDASAELGAFLLVKCPRLRVLATSRHVMPLHSAITIPVPPLAAPNAEVLAAPESKDSLTNALLEFDAVQLFVDCASRALPAFQPTPDNLRAAARICAGLDGVPLAIELAAAHVRGLTVAHIAARLYDLLPRLSLTPSPAASRHETLRAAVEWSYGLLTDSERVLLRRLGAFAGGFTLEAAEAVCEGDGIAESRVLDLLLNLVDKSLVQHAEVDGEGRYRLLETIRAYAVEKLMESEEEEGVRARHADHYRALAEGSEAGILGPREAEWLARLDREHDNFRAALRFCGGPILRLQMAGALWRYWHDRDHYYEGRRWLESTLAEASEISSNTARAMRGAAVMAWRQGDLSAAHHWLDEALRMSTILEDCSGQANSLNLQGYLAYEAGDHQTARRTLERSLELFRETGDLRGVAFALENLAVLALDAGDIDRAEPLLEECESLLHAVGCEQTAGAVLNHLALIAVTRRQYESAQSLLERSLSIHHRFRNRPNAAQATCNLGALAVVRGELETARSLLERGLAEWRSLGNPRGIAAAMTSLAWMYAQGRDPRRAARLFGAVAALRDSLCCPVVSAWREQHDRHLEAVRSALTDEEFDRGWNEGQRLTVEQALELATARETG
jgi:predicted ATPase/DNA-binding SARP family transcriptional activator/Flp pilus assembly protein TadD